jgi:hypothetical protein
MNTYYTSLFIFSILLYFILTDNSFATFIVLLSKIFRVWYEKIKWWIIYNPSNPVVKYLMWKRSMKLAEELMEQYNLKDLKDE